jgi:ribonuclease P protein component
MQTFDKKEHLCSHIQIQELMKNGHAFNVFPFRCVWLEIPKTDSFIQIAIAVPKKKLKFAHQRNLVRRRIRSLYRLNKELIINDIDQYHHTLLCLIVYNDSQVLSYETLQEKIFVVFERLHKQLFVNLSVKNDKKDE